MRLEFLSILLMGLLSVNSMAKELPKKMIHLNIRDKHVEDTLHSIFDEVSPLKWKSEQKLTEIDEKKFNIDIESVRWDIVFKSVLSSMGLSYRYVNNKIIEVYKSK